MNLIRAYWLTVLVMMPTVAPLAALAVGCSAFKAENVPALVATCGPAAMATAASIAKIVNEGGRNWFSDFTVAVDAVKDASCLASFFAPTPAEKMGALDASLLERRQIARGYLLARSRWQASRAAAK